MVRKKRFLKYDPLSLCRWNVASLCCSEDGRPNYPESDVSLFCSHTCSENIRNTESVLILGYKQFLIHKKVSDMDLQVIYMTYFLITTTTNNISEIIYL